MTTKRQEYILIALFTAILLFVLANAGLYFTRFDLTENRVFTISEVSRNLFSEIDDRVSVTYYVTDKLKRYSPVPSQVEDLLHEYAAYARGKISIAVRDPVETDEAAKAEQYGVIPQQVQIIERNERSMTLMYSGIVIEYLDRYRVLPLVFDTATLEYELTSQIRGLVRDERLMIGLLSGTTDRTIESHYRYLSERLSEHYTVRELERGAPIGSEISALFVLGNRDLDEYDFFRIERYLLGGGNALFAVDGVYVDPERYFATERIEDSPVLEFLSKNGIRIGNSLVLDRYSKQIPLRQQQGRVTIQRLEPYPHWISLTGSNASSGNPVTARLRGLDLLWASPLTVTGSDGLETEVILRSSPDAWLMSEYLTTNPLESGTFGLQAGTSRGTYDLGAAVSGTVASLFEGRPLPERAGEPSLAQEPPVKPAPTQFIVIGDGDFASDFIGLSDSAYNLEFLENAAEWLTNDADMLAIKTRAARDTRLNRIQDPIQKRFRILYAEILNIVVIPLLVVLAGFLRWYIRRERGTEHGNTQNDQTTAKGGAA